MMKAILGVAALAALATPAMAQNATFNVNLAASVPPTCAASTAYLASAPGVFPGAGNDQLPGSSTQFTANLSDAAPQGLGSMTARCNTGTANLNVTSANGFKLINGAGGANREIPYALNISGGGGASGITATHNGTIGGTGPAAQQTRGFQFDLPAAVNPSTLWAGNYADTVVATFSPNP